MALTSLTGHSATPRTPSGPSRQTTRASAGSEGKSAPARGACAEGCRRCEAGGTWDRPQDWDCHRGRHGARRSYRSSRSCRRCPSRNRRAAAAGNAAKEGLNFAFSASRFVLFPVLIQTHRVNASVLMSGSMVLQRNAGSSSDGTEDSDFSTDLEHTDSSESDGTSRRSARVTRSSARLSQSSQDSSPVRNLPSFGAEEPVYSTRRVTRSQQQPAPVTPKKYPLRQTRSSGSETEQVVDFSDRETKNTADHDESPPRTPTGNAPSSESDIDISSPNVSHDESIAKDMSLKDSGSDLSHRPKRRRFHESYNFNMKCPTPGCNSLGHLTGKHERHFSISGCPLYHNLSADECKVRAQSRDKQIEERMLSHRQDDNNRHATRHQAPTDRQLRYKEKVAELRKKRNSGLSKEQKEKYLEHRQTYGNTREPLLENLTSEYDLDLFRRAQARASEDLEKLRLQGQITEGSNMIKTIAFGRYELDTWYHSPYPEEYARLGRLYMCEFCLKYMKSQTILRRHMWH
ncbi:histone acetyltransferase KAT7 isoform X5 [Myotis myotis]|uniref:histone acetyltransferase KAT7 isoform X5 n=1 Tax=Myotis myotis TaxID=51298 RepID=UPI00174A6437|nr:histone acetyltransferase KAT7 isoform X5 [Myotis myotis]